MRALSTEAEGLCCQHAQQSPRGGQCWRSFSVGVWKDCHGYLAIIPVSCEYQCGGTRIPGTDESVLFLKQNVNYLEAPTVSSGEYSCEENPEHLRVLTLLGPNPKRSLVIAETVSPKSLRNFWMTNSNAVYFSLFQFHFTLFLSWMVWTLGSTVSHLFCLWEPIGRPTLCFLSRSLRSHKR